MVLKRVVREKIVDYYKSAEWNAIMDTMSRGHKDCLHSHIYLDSIVHPLSFLDVAYLYFEKLGLKMGRRVPITTLGPAHAVLYYLQPGNLNHFEFFLRFNDEIVVEPPTLPGGGKGLTFEYWDKAGMEKRYEKFNFAPMGADDERLVQDFFRGEAWEELVDLLAYQASSYGHAHCTVDTKYHPEDLLKQGVKAIEARGWKVGRAVSIVYPLYGYEQGKISFLLQEPQIVLELEYNHNPDVTIEPRRHPVTHILTYEEARKHLSGIPYHTFDSDDLKWIGENLPLSR